MWRRERREVRDGSRGGGVLNDEFLVVGASDERELSRGRILVERGDAICLVVLTSRKKRDREERRVVREVEEEEYSITKSS